MAITNALIANLAVGTAQIQDASVTDAKITALTISKLSGYGTIAVSGPVDFVGSYTVRVNDTTGAASISTDGDIQTDGVFRVGTRGTSGTRGWTGNVSFSGAINGGSSGIVKVTYQGGIVTSAVYIG